MSTETDDEKDRAEFMVLGKRYAELGRLLPTVDAVRRADADAVAAAADADAVAAARLVGAEMREVRAEIDALFDRVAARHRTR